MAVLQFFGHICTFQGTVKAWIFGMVRGGIIWVDLMKRLKCKKWLKVGLWYKRFIFGRSLLPNTNNFTKVQKMCQNTGKTCVAFKKNFTHLHLTHTPLVQVAIEVMATTFTLRFQDILLRLSTSFLDDFCIVLVTNSNKKGQLLMRKCAAWWLGGWKQGLQIDYMMTISIPFIEFHITSKPLGIIQLGDSLQIIIQWTNCIHTYFIFNPWNPPFQSSETGNIFGAFFVDPPKDLSPKVPQSSYVTWRCHENPRTCHAIRKRRWPVQPWEPIFGTWKEWEWFI